MLQRDHERKITCLLSIRIKCSPDCLQVDMQCWRPIPLGSINSFCGFHRVYLEFSAERVGVAAGVGARISQTPGCAGSRGGGTQYIVAGMYEASKV